jgi:hypothetical protein
MRFGGFPHIFRQSDSLLVTLGVRAGFVLHVAGDGSIS